MKKQIIIIAAILSIMLSTAVSEARARRVYVQVKPPARKVVVVKAEKPYANALWRSGYWKWNGKKYIWVKGEWYKPRKGFVWVHGQWKKTAKGWIWTEGHWNKR